jgi:hypothetical protein
MTKFNFTEGIRISCAETAKKHIGQVCKANDRYGNLRDFGRIHHVTPTTIFYERLMKKENGEFIPHPTAFNPVTRNNFNIRRDIKLITITQM